MSYTKNFRIRCDGCGLFCVPIDEETPFGCSSYEPCPEPHDPAHYCKKCSKALYKEWLGAFQRGRRWGCWQKSDAERNAAKKCGLIWIGQNGIGKYGTEEWRDYTYITQEEYQRLKTQSKE